MLVAVWGWREGTPRNKAGIASFPKRLQGRRTILMARECNGKADAVEPVSKALPPVAVIVALAVCMLAFPPAVLAQPQSVGELLVGKAAFGDWRTDAPMVRRKITDLPPPYATRSASNPPRVIGKPISPSRGAAGIPGRAIRVQPPRSAHNSGCAEWGHLYR